MSDDEKFAAWVAKFDTAPANQPAPPAPKMQAWVQGHALDISPPAQPSAAALLTQPAPPFEPAPLPPADGRKHSGLGHRAEERCALAAALINSVRKTGGDLAFEQQVLAVMRDERGIEYDPIGNRWRMREQ